MPNRDISQIQLQGAPSANHRRGRPRARLLCVCKVDGSSEAHGRRLSSPHTSHGSHRALRGASGGNLGHVDGELNRPCFRPMGMGAMVGEPRNPGGPMRLDMLLLAVRGACIGATTHRCSGLDARP